MSRLSTDKILPADIGRLRRELYPVIEPFDEGRLRVSDLHEIYYEQSGQRRGVPVIGVHGGPGGGSTPEMRRFFAPDRSRIILFDQRGCGQSTPFSELRENTTWDLVADMERLRQHLKLDSWVVFGGSWGSTLALAYALTHPERVKALILRGIFLLTRAEILWFYQDGASHIYPDAWEHYLAPIPATERGDLLNAYWRRLNSPDSAIRLEAARAWSRWEGSALSIAGPAARPPRFDDDRFVDAFARIECHYFVHRGFFPEDGWLLREAGKLHGIPGHIVHGRYDMCTPISSAWALKKAWPQAKLSIIPDAGHSSTEPGIVDALVRACDSAVS